MKTRTYHKIWLILLLCAIPITLFAREDSKIDSLLNNRSVEALVRMRKALAKERDRLLRSQEKIRDRGVDVTKEFLDVTSEENANQDKILVRIAEYYIEEAQLDLERRIDADFEPALAEYERQLAAYERGDISVEPVPPKEPRIDYQRAIQVYDLLINNFPESGMIDDAYYNKAFLLKKMGEEESAIRFFQRVIDEYPESEFAPEAYMNLAEGFFAPKPEDSKSVTVEKLNKAIQLYKNVLYYKDSPRYDEALYKLGWSYYRLAGENPDNYSDAIVYFTAVVQDIQRFKELDPSGDLIRANVEPEALEFVAASFVDQQYARNGVDNARRFIERLNTPQWGIRVMENLGDRFAKIARWDEARNAYNSLLDMYPEYEFAPGVQKKIADAYVAEGNISLSFTEREKLFDNYNPGSAWYKQLESSEKPTRIQAIDDAYRITEEALRINVTYVYSIAEAAKTDTTGNARQLFTRFVELCQIYLANFPTDENAYDINWSMAFVMDTELGRLEESFVEYIRVSNDYLETEHQLDAAVNAITVADSLVKLSRAVQTMEEGEDEQLISRQVQDLSKEEKMLAEAFDNYIKLFPDSPRTPEILAAAGQLYYAHKKYALARKYYKTMVTKFPESQQKSIGLVSLMNSYFFLGQYRDAEIVAKKILTTADMPESQIEIAKNRIGESIFKNGERLEQENNYLEAAKEYRRVYEDAAQYVNFVDNSLFRSSRNFERAGEWQKAIETYNILIENYPNSKHVLAALGNIAADYKEIEDFNNVARTNERIFEKFPGTPEAENALYNASIFYARAEAWSDGIRTNNLYIKTYPSNPESKDLLFENAKFYLKLDQLENANQIYEEFAQRYPNDPKTIEAYYNRGQYYYERDQFEQAKTEFYKAIQRSDELKSTGQNPNLYYAAESNYKLGQILNREYQAIQLGGSQEQLRAQLLDKRNRLGEVEKAFAKVVQSGSIRGFEAMYRIAEGYEHLADGIANQQFPENLTKEERLVQETQVFRAALPAYEEAVNRYKEVMINIPELANRLEISLDSTAAPKQTELVVQDTSVLVQKEVEVDSSRQVALRWQQRTKDKISSIQYNVADRSSEFIDKYLRVENPNQGLLALVYSDQVLKTLVAPQVQVTIDAHMKNLEVASELGLDNKYVAESRRKILLTRGVLGDQYANLTKQVLQMYRNALPGLETLIEGGETATDDQGRDYYAYQDEYLMQLIYNSKEYSNIALGQYSNTIALANERSINNDARKTIEQDMFSFAYEVGAQMLELSANAQKKSEFYLQRFDSTQNENFQLGSTFFDDQYFELNDNAKVLMSGAYEASKEMGVENIWTQLLLASLVKLDPGTYLADMPRQETNIASDASWRATNRYTQGWNLLTFDDSGWRNANIVDIPVTLSFAKFDSLGVSPQAIWIATFESGASTGQAIDPLRMEDRSVEDTSAIGAVGDAGTKMPVSPDSLAKSAISTMSNLAEASGVVNEPDTLTAYFRKVMNFESKPVGGWLALTGDNSYRLYINDVYITGVDSSDYKSVEVIKFETFSEFLKEGKNLVAVSVTDVDGPPRRGLRLQMYLELLPGEVTDIQKNIQSRLQQEDIPVEQLKKVDTLNRNRIVK